MKKLHFLVYLFLLVFPSTILCQSRQKEKVQSAANDSDYEFPILYENNAFGYGKNIFLSISQQVFEKVDNSQAVFINAGVNKYFSLSAGAIVTKFHKAQFIYLSPEFFYPIKKDLRMALQVKSLRDFNFDVFIFNPTLLLSYGSSAKNITIGWGPYLDSKGNYEHLFPIDGLYADGALKLNLRYPLNDKTGVFSNNEYTVADVVQRENRATFFITKTGVDYHLDRINVFAAVLLLHNNNTLFQSQTLRQYSFGFNYKMHTSK